jgi:hypothetical protein
LFPNDFARIFDEPNLFYGGNSHTTRLSSVLPYIKIEQLPPETRRDVEQYLREEPHSPAARLRPYVLETNDVWLAFVGPEVREGAIGFGLSPCAALEDFSRGYLEPLVSRNGSGPH